MLRSALAIVLLAGVVVPAAAQTQGKFKFVSGNPYGNPTLAVNGGNYYTSIYRGQFLAGVPGNPTVDIFCVDFFHSVSPNNEWDAWFSPLSGDLSKTYGMSIRGWSQGIAAERYRAAAWLATQFGSPVGGYDAGEKANWPNLQAAVWSLMGQDVGGTTSFPLALNGTQQNWLNTALTSGNTAEFQAQASDWTVISGVNASATTGKQEFLVQQSVVPEPETVILLVTGLLAIGAVAYFRGFGA